VFSAFEYPDGSGVPGFASALSTARVFSVVTLARHGRSRLCLHDSGVLGRILVSEYGCFQFCLRLSYKKSAPLQKPRITARDRSNGRTNPRVACGPPRAAGQPTHAVTAPDATDPRARQASHAFRNRDSPRVRRYCRYSVNKACIRAERLSNKLASYPLARDTSM